MSEAPAIVRIDRLPGNALDAAAAFHAGHLPAIRSQAPVTGLTVAILSHAPEDHDGWRLAAVQGLARELAPRRIIFLQAGDAGAEREAIDYLAAAPGVTGQYLKLEPVSA